MAEHGIGIVPVPVEQCRRDVCRQGFAISAAESALRDVIFVEPDRRFDTFGDIQAQLISLQKGGIRCIGNRC